jgi:hypothetical protein
VKRSGWKQRSALFLPLAGIVGTVLSVGVMALSPSISATLDAGKVPLGTALRLSLTHTAAAYAGFFRTQYLVVLVILTFGFMVAVAGWQATHRTDDPKSALGLTVLSLALAQMVSLLLIFAIMLPSAYSRGVYPDPRHLIAVSVVMVFNLIFVGFIIGKQGLALLVLLPKGMRKVSFFGAALILLAVGLLYPVRYLPQTIQDRYLYQYWVQEWTERDTVIRAAAARGEPEVHVLEMDHLIEDVGELGSEPDRNWYNQCAANAYGIVIYADQPGWDEGLTQYLSTRQ